MSETTSYTIPEFAAACLERCTRQAQGVDMHCGDTYADDNGEDVFVFCGNHWAFVLGAE